ncbi:MAG TPA: hypothetical protein PK395_07550 [bacterium]|nr:hypothetical protein [bacterium]
MNEYRRGCHHYPITESAVRCDRPRTEQGIALLTVLALLTVFGLILLGFTYSLRLEELTVLSYTETSKVTEAAEAGIGGGLSLVDTELAATNGKYVLGKKQPRYTSRNDASLKVGVAGFLSNDTSFDARSARYNPWSTAVKRGTSLPIAAPLGIDEDPPGDTTGPMNARGVMTADGFPGFAGVDDNLDGAIDNGNLSDDDEDGQVDEDPLDLRRDGHFFPQGTGFDADGDAQGVFDESGKININYAGNTSGDGNGYSYGQGATPFELDLAVFLHGRMIQQADEMAKRIVNYRQGNVNGGGSSYAAPGTSGDDDGDNSKDIQEVRPLSEVFENVNQQTEYALHVLVGNGKDDDGDGLVDEEDERYIGASDESDGQPAHRIPQAGELSESEVLAFRLGDRIDNDGDGMIDEQDEGIDEPDEFTPNSPRGDDHPFATLDETTVLFQLGAVTLSKIENFATVYSEADQISPSLSAEGVEFLKLNPNLLSNWGTVDTEEVGSDFQYGPKLSIRDFFAMHVDNDGDWQALGEGPGNGIDERGDGQTDDKIGDGINQKDDDGDGLIDEPSDDWDRNGYPSADFDRYGEPDVGAPYYIGNSVDDDRDGQTDEGRNTQDRSEHRLRGLGDDDRPRMESNRTDLLAGMVQEGNGADDDGDGVIDDTGDFNGDWMISYDPEWHLNEDPDGDANGDGYPGIGVSTTAPEGSAAGDLAVERQSTKLRAQNANERLTSFADDDGDGFADFRDPQVIAAMYRADGDLVDNDGDGEVDEPGERYIAAWDDDEDGRMDEDPPEFQLILNMLDYIDQPFPTPVSGDPDVQAVLRLQLEDLVLVDPPSVFNFKNGITSTRQRAFEMNPQFLSGPNRQQKALLENEMDLLLPNPPEVTNPVTYRGVEGVRINEALVKPMIRLEAEQTLTTLQDNGQGGYAWTSNGPNGRFVVNGGNDDDGLYGTLTGGTEIADTNWSDSILVRPRGFQNTVLPYGSLTAAGLYDSMAPSIVFAVTNTQVVTSQGEEESQGGGTGGGGGVGSEAETATWIFENVPPGVYDVVLYLDPMDSLRGEVEYSINSQQVLMRSDFFYQDPENQEAVDGLMPILPLEYGGKTGFALNGYLHYTAKLPPAYVRYLNTNVIPGIRGLGNDFYNKWSVYLASSPDLRLAQAYNNQFLMNPISGAFVAPVEGQNPGNLVATSMLRLPYRLYPRDTSFRAVVDSNGRLTVQIKANPPEVGYYMTTFDRIELINLSAQYLELVNLTPDDIDLTGWTVNTPYGKYILQTVGGVRPIIPRIKPLFEKDDGRETALDNGIPLPGRPWDRAAYPTERGGLAGKTRTQDDIRMDNNYLLLVHDRDGFVTWANANYPGFDENVPVLAPETVTTGGVSPAYNPYGELSTFKLVDRENDILTDNYDLKTVTLTDPAGNEVDRLEYKTTFNNLVVDIPGNVFRLPVQDPAEPLYEIASLDVIALPGYRGMETFERGDPTQVVTEKRPDRSQDTQRFTPTMRLLAREAAIETFAVQPGSEERDPLTVTLYGNRSLSANPSLVVSENPGTDLDDRRYQGGWDFVGDAPDPGQTGFDPDGNPWGGPARCPEFGSGTLFKQQAGGLENYTNILVSPLDLPPSGRAYPGDLVRYTWTLGLRELVRAGFDPDVDDHLTVRVRGKSQELGFFPAIVGEVLTHPMFTVVDPGEEREGGTYNQPQVEANPLNPVPFDAFTKLRDGDTAFTVDLRESFQDLYRDLDTSEAQEPLIVLRMIMRKTTPDIMNTLDDNYYFYGIELSGRGRMNGGSSDSVQDNARMALIAGTPGRANAGYVPAYPRRRRMIDTPSQRDQFDIVDNTPFVKNGLLATPGEISRIMTGGRFETVCGPMIPQRLEDKTIYQNQIDSNAELGRRLIPSDENDTDRLILAQRERLDQMENQYSLLYSMVTTSDSPVTPGLINVNTAIREVLAALPASPANRDDPSEIRNLQERFTINSMVADFIIEGRNPLGRDQQMGVAEIDDDVSSRGTLDDSVEYKLPSVGRSEAFLKEFSSTSKYSSVPAIEKVLSDDAIGMKDVQDRRSNVQEVYASSAVSLPDDGPYEDISRLLSDLVHMKRRDRTAAAVRRDLDRTGDGVTDGMGDLRERLNKRLNLSGENALTPRDMEEMMHRLSGMISVNSRVFHVVTDGKAIAGEGEVAASRRYKSVYRR